jgi:hypothetical protein
VLCVLGCVERLVHARRMDEFARMLFVRVLRLCSGLALRLRYAQDDEFRGDVVFREVREAMGDQRSSRAAGFAKEWHGGGRAR